MSYPILGRSRARLRHRRPRQPRLEPGGVPAGIFCVSARMAWHPEDVTDHGIPAAMDTFYGIDFTGQIPQALFLE